MKPTHPTAPRLFDDPAALAAARVQRIERADGGFVLCHPDPLREPARCLGEWLDQWARSTPGALFLAERDASGCAGAVAELYDDDDAAGRVIRP